jgi:hypothetical protein
MAAALLEGDWLLQATSSGYMRAWGWWRPMLMSRELISRRTGTLLMWMRAMICRGEVVCESMDVQRVGSII